MGERKSSRPRLLGNGVKGCVQSMRVATFPSLRLFCLLGLMLSLISCANEAGISTGKTDPKNAPTFLATGASPVWSPDGKQIAFVSNRDGNAEIYIMNADGTRQTRLTNNSLNEYNPIWSPDGKQIAFIVAGKDETDNNHEIYVINTDGSGQTNLSRNVARDAQAVWSPDGKRIAFISDRNSLKQSQNADIYTINPDGTGLTRLTNTPETEFHPSWSPDGKRIAFTRFTTDIGTQIYVMNAVGSQETQLTVPDQGFDLDLYPMWSPDSQQLFYSTLQEIFVINADGSGKRSLTNNFRSNFGLTLSPDGTQIAFISNRDGNNEIYVMKADGTGQTRLTNNQESEQYPAWSPDGTRLAFTSFPDSQAKIYLVGGLERSSLP